MPPFEYTPYRNPYVQSISALLQAPGQIAAQEALQKGNAWAQAAQQIGQTVAAIPQQIQQQKTQAVQQQLGQQAVAKGQVEASDLAALDKAFTSGGGRDAILSSLPGHMRPQVAASFSAADEAASKLQEQQLKTNALSQDYVYTLATQIAAHNYDPVAAQLGLSHAKQTFATNPAIANQITQLEAQLHENATPDTVKALIQPIIAAHDAAEKPVVLPPTPEGAAPAQLVRPNSMGGATPVATGGVSQPKPKTETELATDAANPNSPTHDASAAALALLKPKPADSDQKQPALIDGKPGFVLVDPKKPGDVRDLNGKQIENAAQRVVPIPNATALMLRDVASWTPDQIDFYAKQIKEDASKMSLINGLEKPVKDKIMQRIAGLGGDVNKISESSRIMSEMAKEILPHIDTIQAEANQLNQLGLLGPIGSRWRDFLAGKIGAGELAGGNTANAQLIGKFKTDAGLLKTAVARAHGGARGGGSPQMLNHMNDLFGSDKADLSTLTGELNGFKDWMQGYAGMLPSATGPTPSATPDLYQQYLNRTKK